MQFSVAYAFARFIQCCSPLLESVRSTTSSAYQLATSAAAPTFLSISCGKSSIIILNNVGLNESPCGTSDIVRMRSLESPLTYIFPGESIAEIIPASSRCSVERTKASSVFLRVLTYAPFESNAAICLKPLRRRASKWAIEFSVPVFFRNPHRRGWKVSLLRTLRSTAERHRSPIIFKTERYSLTLVVLFDQGRPRLLLGWS